MAKARNIYGVGQMAEATLPRSRGARQRLVSLLQPAIAMPVLSPYPAPMVQAPMTCPACPPCGGMAPPPPPPPAGGINTSRPGIPPGVQLSAEVPFVTMMPKSAIIAAIYSAGQVQIDAVDGTGRPVRLVSTSAPREDNVIEAWDTSRSFVTNVALGNLN